MSRRSRSALSTAVAAAGLAAALWQPAAFAQRAAPDAAPPAQATPGPRAQPQQPQPAPQGPEHAPGVQPQAPSGEVDGGGGALLKIDVIRLQRGLRASKVIGATVYNDAKAKIGTIHDLIIEGGDKLLFGVISVGGFLGVGDRLVAVPYQALQIQPDKVVLSGVTKAELEKAPEFRYAKAGGK